MSPPQTLPKSEIAYLKVCLLYTSDAADRAI